MNVFSLIEFDLNPFDLCAQKSEVLLQPTYSALCYSAYLLEH